MSEREDQSLPLKRKVSSFTARASQWASGGEGERVAADWLSARHGGRMHGEEAANGAAAACECVARPGGERNSACRRTKGIGL